MQPYIKTLQMSQNGHIRCITVGFVDTKINVHFRLNQYGITSVKSPITKMSSNYSTYSDEAMKMASELVTKTTGKVRWFPRSNSGIPTRNEMVEV